MTCAVAASLLIALPIVDRLTANDFALGLLLNSVEYFALGLGTLGTLLYLWLLFCRDASKSIKLRGIVAVSLPYAVFTILWLLVRFQDKFLKP